MEAAAGRRSTTVMVIVTVTVTVMLCCAGVVLGDNESLTKQCSGEFDNVVVCMSYATGQAGKPTTKCCDSVKEIRAKDPACLCLFIQQVHNGSAQLQSLGILESRLLQLAPVCSIQNSSISDCPKLLGISPTSPDFAFFSNASTTAPPAAPNGTTSLPDTANSPSAAAKRGVELPNSILLVAAAVFLCAFTIGSSS
ncbi:hypothetical protein SAY87_001736 [Trapa incisa]|uniref:Bifunctional inhibitor/plant lipid transfer protein/seed storage helical domain-containing protein n=1 Tax=Trapa incisa TaxID=236973 RepID=A0AAN7PSS3_9MYRT|nr:hypothetical protein SAY87_001736 [Trapa incisa]